MCYRKRNNPYLKILNRNKELIETISKMNSPETPEGQAILFVLLPALVNFTIWILINAKKNKIKRLYFLSRDGYLMYQAARSLSYKMGISVECRYLYCSRFSLRMPMFHKDFRQALEYLCSKGIDVSVIKVLRRAGLSNREIKNVIEELKIPYNIYEPITGKMLYELKNKLMQCPIFLKYLENHSKESARMFYGYLRQEGLLEEIPMAVVDSGWTGSMQKLLDDACLLFGKNRRLEGFYWGLYETPKGTIRSKYHCYYFSPEKNLVEKVFFSNCLFEAVFTAPHGMVTGYRKEGCFRPCCKEMVTEENNIIGQLEKYLEEFITAYLQCSGGENLGKQAIKSKKILKKLFRVLMCMPTEEEASVFGNLLFSDDVTDEGKTLLANPLTEKELRESHLSHRAIRIILRNHIPLKESAWYEGSAVLYGQNPVSHVRSFIILKFIRFFRKQLRESIKNL